MGWLFKNGYSRKDIIRDIIAENEGRKCLTHVTRGNVLWSVWEMNRNGRDVLTILCHLLGKDDFGWGYKDMCETESPSYFSCPLRYLEMVPFEKTDYSDIEMERVKEWRKTVQENQNPAAYRQLVEAVRHIRKEKTREKIYISLKHDWRPSGYLLLESLRPLSVRHGGRRWKIRKSSIETFRIVPHELESPIILDSID